MILYYTIKTKNIPVNESLPNPVPETKPRNFDALKKKLCPHFEDY